MMRCGIQMPSRNPSIHRHRQSNSNGDYLQGSWGGVVPTHLQQGEEGRHVCKEALIKWLHACCILGVERKISEHNLGEEGRNTKEALST